MDRVYLVYTDNGEIFGDDYYEEVEHVFTSHEKASLHLIELGYSPYCDWFMDKPNLRFIKRGKSWYGNVVNYGAWIVEKAVEK